MERKDIHIILDYGHAQRTPGKCSPLYSTTSGSYKEFFLTKPEFGKDRYYEYLSNRIIGKKIFSALECAGFSVHETISDISSPIDISLTERVRRTNTICAKYGAGNCLFLSIHSNAAGNGGWMNARGWSGWTTKGQNNSDKLATSLYKFADLYFLSDGQKVRKDATDKDPDYEANFAVIKGANCPAILTESFFYDNKDDLMYLMSDKGVSNIVKVHLEGVLDYLKQYKGIK